MSDPMVDAGVAADRAERLTRTIRDQTFPNLKPRNSATLILIDRAHAVPKLLAGEDICVTVFMPGKFASPAAASSRPTANVTTSHRCKKRYITG